MLTVDILNIAGVVGSFLLEADLGGALVASGELRLSAIPFKCFLASLLINLLFDVGQLTNLSGQLTLLNPQLIFLHLSNALLQDTRVNRLFFVGGCEPG